MASSSVESVCCYGHRTRRRRSFTRNKKGRVSTRPAGTFRTRGVSVSATAWVSRLTSERPASALCSRASESPALQAGRCCRSRNAGLHVIGFDDRLGDVHCVLVPPQYRALRPRLRCIHDHAVPIFLRDTSRSSAPSSAGYGWQYPAAGCQTLPGHPARCDQKASCLPSICFLRVSRASWFSLSCCVLSCFFSCSSSSF